jgi:hypothetical protein
MRWNPVAGQVMQHAFVGKTIKASFWVSLGVFALAGILMLGLKSLLGA